MCIDNGFRVRRPILEGLTKSHGLMRLSISRSSSCTSLGIITFILLVLKHFDEIFGWSQLNSVPDKTKISSGRSQVTLGDKLI